MVTYFVNYIKWREIDLMQTNSDETSKKRL